MELNDKFKPRRCCILFLFSVFFVLLIISHFWGANLIGPVGFFDLVLLSIALIIIILIAGLFVIQSLVAVAAELSLIILLAQSYCDVIVRSNQCPDANPLKNLIYVGLFYISIKFYKDLKKNLSDFLNDKKNKINSFGKVFILFFITWFIWQVIVILIPIFSDLCVFKQCSQ